MKLVYVGDFRDLPNWGCRATGAALAQMLVGEHTIIDTIGVETLHGTAWHEYAEPPVIYRDILPRRLFDHFWRARRVNARSANAYFRLERHLGARLDFISESPDESVKQFHLARRSNPRLQEICRSIETCDALVFNGEGTMVFSTPARRDVLYNLFLIKLGQNLGKQVYFVNAMFSDCPYTGRNNSTLVSAAALLDDCMAVVCRDRESFGYVKAFAPKANVTSVPDALFTWKSKVERAAAAVGQSADVTLPYGQERLLDQIDLDRPYICVSGSSSASVHPDHVSGYAMLVTELQKLGLPVYVVCTCLSDLFLQLVGAKTGAKVIPYQIPVMAGAGILARARLVVSGRFHPSIMASLGGTPCIFLGSNSHKTRSIQGVLKYERVREYSSVPGPDEVSEIVACAKQMLARENEQRQQIGAVAGERMQQAWEVMRVIAGTSVTPIL